MTDEKKKPVKTFRAGSVTATIWPQTGKTKEGKEFNTTSISVERSYLDKDKKWQKTPVMRLNDLPKVALVSNEAYAFILQEMKDESEDKE